MNELAANLSGAAEESAQFHLIKHVPVVRPGATSAEVLAMLPGQSFEYAEVIVVTDADRHVIGMVSVGTLAMRQADVRVEEVMHRDVPLASVDTDQERVASLAIQSELGSVCVVDASRRFIGLITSQTLLSVLRREHVEDLHRLTGITRESQEARAAIEGPPLRRARHRLPWLFVGLAGSGLAALLMARFASVLQTRIEVAFFLPGIVYLADAIGTQTEAIAVRGLSLSHLSIKDLLLRELSTGLTLGAVLGLVSAAGVWVVLQDVPLSLSVGIALFAASSIAASIGLVLPWAFHRAGYDPAYGSGPLGTVAQDILSVLLYFLSVTAVLQIAT